MAWTGKGRAVGAGQVGACLTALVRRVVSGSEGRRPLVPLTWIPVLLMLKMCRVVIARGQRSGEKRLWVLINNQSSGEEAHEPWGHMFSSAALTSAWPEVDELIGAVSQQNKVSG